MTKEEIVIQFASENLNGVKRAVDGSAFDHSLRVAEYIREDLMIDDSDIYISALLHDVFEDTDVDQEVFLYVFGEEIYRTLLDLTRSESKSASNLDRMREKIAHNLELMDSSFATRIVKCSDRIDNLNDSLRISPSSKKFDRIPYWVVETKYSIYPLARMTHKKAFEDVKKTTEEIESHFTLMVEKIEREYLLATGSGMSVSSKVTTQSV